MKIQDLRARESIDCKGKPLLEVDIITEDGTMGRAASPSGISAGEHEAMVLRDGDQSRYDGNGVRKAAAAGKTPSEGRGVVKLCILQLGYVDLPGVEQGLKLLKRDDAVDIGLYRVQLCGAFFRGARPDKDDLCLRMPSLDEF